MVRHSCQHMYAWCVSTARLRMPQDHPIEIPQGDMPMDSYTEKDRANKLNSLLGDPLWITHVRDHIRLLKRNATIVKIPDDTFYTYRSRILRLLEAMQFDSDAVIPIIVMNNIEMSGELAHINQTLSIPTEAAVRLLVESFQ